MKRLIILLAFVLFAAAGCQEKKPADYTRLGDFTPNSSLQEKLNGKVESVVEKSYWAIPDGDTYIRGARLTRHEIDSLKISNDFRAEFDAGGNLVSCTTIDENDAVITRRDMIKVNELVTRAEFRSGDTLKSYVIITSKDDGLPTLYESFDALTDTLRQRFDETGTDISDTIRVRGFSPGGELQGTAEYVYNELGLLTSTYGYGPDGTLEGRMEIKYNDRGFMSEIKFKEGEGKIKTMYTLTYEQVDNGNWVRAIFRDHEDDRIFITERVITYFE